jgi:hypothetical protein
LGEILEDLIFRKQLGEPVDLVGELLPTLLELQAIDIGVVPVIEADQH